MKLIAKRYRRQDRFGTPCGYHIRWRIDKEEARMVELPLYAKDQKLEKLAERWFTIFSPHVQIDANKSLCGALDGWSVLTADNLFNNGCELSSSDATVLLAAEERIRRAFAMLMLVLVHEKLFDEQEHVLNTEISSGVPRVVATDLPTLLSA